MPLIIHLFGPFRVVVDGLQVDDQQWGRRKSKTLLKILALQPLRQSSRQMHREELIELLWPGGDAEQGLNSLHKALHAARRALEPGLSAGASSRFLAMRDQLVLLQSADDVRVDVAEFEALADEASKIGQREAIEAALALYPADLLPEDLYEDWAAVPREQLRARKEQLLRLFASVCEAEGDSRPAIEACSRLLASNPCNESAHRGLMRLYAAAGQRYLAVEQFRVCTEILRREMDADPEPETAALYERILAGTGLSQGGGAAVAPETPPVVAGSIPVAAVAKARPQWLRYALGGVLVTCLAALAVFLSRTPLYSSLPSCRWLQRPTRPNSITSLKASPRVSSTACHACGRSA